MAKITQGNKTLFFWRDTPADDNENDFLLCKCGRYLDEDGNCPYCSGLIKPDYDDYDCCNYIKP